MADNYGFLPQVSNTSSVILYHCERCIFQPSGELIVNKNHTKPDYELFGNLKSGVAAACLGFCMTNSKMVALPVLTYQTK